MSVEQWMGLDIQGTLRQNPLLKLHPVLRDDAVEVDTSTRLRSGQTVQAIERTIPCQNNPLVTRASIVVEYWVDRVGKGALRRSRGEYRYHVRSVLRHHIQEAARRTNGLTIRTS